MMTLGNLEKFFLIKYMLISNKSILIIVNNSSKGVRVPEHLLSHHSTTLRLGINLEPPIDMTIDDKSITALLQFGQESFNCVIPLKAVFAVVSDESGKGPIWPEDAPKEALEHFTAEVMSREESMSKLSVVEGGRGKGSKAKGEPPTLTLVKSDKTH